MAFTECFDVSAAAPFDFDLTAQIFRNGDPQIRSYRDGVFSMVLRFDGQLAFAQVSSAGTIETPRLTVKLTSNQPLTVGDIRKAKEEIKFFFNLDFSLHEFYLQIEGDPTMRSLAKQLYGLKNPTTPTVFESLVDSIVEQQISIKVAIALEQKIVKKFGDRLEVAGEIYFAFPKPETLAAADVAEIQQVGLSRRKAEYIQNAAQMITAGKLNLEAMKNQVDPKEIIAELDDIRGIGVWTAELTMLRGMQRLEALPADDFGIQRVISRYYCGGRRIQAAEARQIAERWGKWKGLAAFYLIIAEVKDLKV